jgi:hypothetical protein
VPTPIEPIAQNTGPQTYYFPPIDVTTPEKNTTDAPATVKAHTNAKVATPVADNGDDKSSNPGERKFRFRFHRKSGWAYGKINTSR